MTVIQERIQIRSLAPSEALIKEWKAAVHDRTQVEPLEADMPYLALELGQKASRISVLNAADNDGGSYKWRGAFNAAHAAKENGATSIAAASAANFGAGVALAGKHFGLRTHLYVPGSTHEDTIAWLKGLAPNGYVHVDTQGENVDHAVELATEYAFRSPQTQLLHPFDSVATMSGQGTMIDDILSSAPDTDQIVITTGGNGAGSGMAQRLVELDRSDIQLTLVQAEGSDSLEQSLKWNEVTSATRPNHLYRGAKVQRIGHYCLAQTMRYPNVNVVTVPDEEVRDTASLYMDQNEQLLRKNIPMYEPTTLLAFTALRSLDSSRKTVIVGTGVNQHPRELFQSTSRFRQPPSRLNYGPDKAHS